MAEISPIVAAKHPAYYLMHKYWSRKPHNLVRAYVEHHTQPGEVVFDPFAGSGVTLIEALLAGRKAIAVDINPIASRIAEATLLPFDRDRLVAAFQAIEQAVRPRVDELFQSSCPDCARRCTIEYAVWQRTAQSEALCEIVLRCPACHPRPLAKQPDPAELRAQPSLAELGVVSAIKRGQMFANSRTLVARNMSVDRLFTARNLAALSLIKAAIDEVADRDVRRILELTFTACVAQASRLIPYRNRLTSGGPAWTVAGFWVAARHLEINAWNCFANRFQKTLRGKAELARLLGPRAYQAAEAFEDLAKAANGWVLTQSATDLRAHIPDASVDYIFTDPPYGDSVPYLEYSTLWSCWFDQPIDYQREIVISNSAERRKGLGEYQALLRQAFAECWRVLKPGRCMTLTFNNRSLDIWSAIAGAIAGAGFEFVSCLYQAPAVVPAKAQLSRDGSAVGDIVLNFRKPHAQAQPSAPRQPPGEVILAAAERAIGERGGEATIDEITRGVMLALLRAGHTGISAASLARALAGCFERQGSRWRFRRAEQHLVRRYEQIADRVRAIVAACAGRGMRDRRQIVASVMAEIPGESLPSLELILSIYEDIMSNSNSK